MATKFEIEQRIIDNERQRKLTPHIDKLEPLIPVKISPEFLETDAFSVLRNSWIKKWPYLVIVAFHIVVIFQIAASLDFSQSWNQVKLAAITVSGIWFTWKFIENKVRLKITPEGLMVFPAIFNRWQDIEYLYFHTKYESDGADDHVCLIVNSKTCHDYEVNVSDLGWTIEKLGRTLYQCMKKYKKSVSVS